MTLSNGNRFEGVMVKGKPHGRGVYEWKSGDKYDGEYKDGKRHGKGEFVYLFRNSA